MNTPSGRNKTVIRQFGSFLLLGLAVVSAGCSQASRGQDSLETEDRAEPIWASVPGVEGRAFRGAVGYGANSKGGRDGRIVPVTTLADSGPGSLRACIELNEPRVCVFRVSGVIRYTTQPPQIRNPYITIAGQTAPGGGITLAHGGGPMGLTPMIIKNTHDVVIRNIRIRNDRIGGNRGSEDSITIMKSENVIIDHVSATWARDELINGYDDNDNITISNSIFAYGIPRHDKCALLGSNPPDPQHLSFIGNLCAHNGDRNPDINFVPGSCIEIVNNVFYNAQSEFAEIWESYGGTTVSLVGNTFKAGPNTSLLTVGIVRQTEGSTGTSSIYMRDNAFDGEFDHVTDSAAQVERERPNCPLTVRPKEAETAYRIVTAKVGAWPRDILDQEIVRSVRKRRGHILNNSTPGEIPAIDAGTPYPDGDGDGMDDRWEPTVGADPRKADSWQDGNRNGTKNFDEFLEYLDSIQVGAGEG